MSNFIKNWTQREVEILAKRVRRYSAVVASLKFLLPLAAVGLIGFLVFESNFSNKKKIFIEAPEKVQKLPEKPVMTNLKYSGLDAKNQPYSLVAKEAVQQSAEQADLKDITADITTNGGSWFSVVAESGSYFNNTRIIQLFGTVNIYITDKNETTHQITMEGADADMLNGVIKSAGKVEARGDYGTLNASGVLIEREKSKISFTGPVKLVIIRK